MPAAAPPIVIQKKRGKGCWGCGCAVLLALAVLIVVLLIFSYRSVHAFAHAYTTATPDPIPTTDAGDAVYQDAQNKLAAFTQAFQREQPATLRLNSDEINTFIARDPNYASMHGKVHVTLQDDTAQIDSSLLLGAVEKVLMPDRYLHTVATLGIGFDPDTRALALNIHQLQLNGQSMPPSANEALNQEINPLVNQQLQANQLAKDFLARVQKIDIENGELVIEIQ